MLKPKRLLLLEQKIKEIKEDIGIFGLNVSNLEKAVIPRKKSTETFKYRPNLFITQSTPFSAKLAKNAKTVCSVGNRHIVNWRFFTF